MAIEFLLTFKNQVQCKYMDNSLDLGTVVILPNTKSAHDSNVKWTVD